MPEPSFTSERVPEPVPVRSLKMVLSEASPPLVSSPILAPAAMPPEVVWLWVRLVTSVSIFEEEKASVPPTPKAMVEPVAAVMLPEVQRAESPP